MNLNLEYMKMLPWPYKQKSLVWVWTKSWNDITAWMHIGMLIVNKNDIVNREYKYRFWMWIDLITPELDVNEKLYTIWIDTDFLNFALFSQLYMIVGLSVGTFNWQL